MSSFILFICIQRRKESPAMRKIKEPILLLFSRWVMSVCDLMGCNLPVFPILHYLPEFAQIHIHWISNAIQPSHPLSSPSPPAFNLSQHQGLFYELAVHIRWPSFGALASASVLPINIQGWSPLGLTGLLSLLSKGLSRVFSSTTVQKGLFFGTQPSLEANSHSHTCLLEKP